MPRGLIHRSTKESKINKCREVNRLTWPPRRNNVNKRRDWNEDSAAIDESKEGHLISQNGKKRRGKGKGIEMQC